MKTRSQQRLSQDRSKTDKPVKGRKAVKTKTRRKKKDKKESASLRVKRLASVRQRYRAHASPGSYGGVGALARVLEGDIAGRRKKGIIEEALRAEESYTLHKPVRYRFPRRRVIVSGPLQQWQADLVDVSSFAADNSGARYLLCAIDVFSKYAWVKTTRTKRGEDVAKAFKDILKEAGKAPAALQTDKGTEFRAKAFQDVLKARDIHYFSGQNDDIKACVVERFQLTLQRKMYRYFSASRSRLYRGILADLVKSYNASYHRSIGMTPSQAMDPSNAEIIWQRLYEGEPRDASKFKPPGSRAPGLKRGDFVRISKTRRTFQRGYLPYWSQEIFRINQVIVATGQSVYKIEDYGGEVLEGVFYEKELQRVDPPDYYDVEEILDTRKRKGATEYLVKWRGYPSSFNSWESDLILAGSGRP